jgi:phosphoribosylglycinamide formyltransferase-1
MSNSSDPSVKGPLRIAVLVSGGGTNLQALIDAMEDRGTPSTQTYHIVAVIADRECFALERAKTAGIPGMLIQPPKGIPRQEGRRIVSDQVLAIARKEGAQALVLAGFLTILTGPVIEEYANRIVNLHPALLPKFGGQGMWGHHVHEAVLAAGETESGCTVHLVDSGCDTGPILLQRRVPVLSGDSPESLAARISGEEHRAIVEGVRLLAERMA